MKIVKNFLYENLIGSWKVPGSFKKEQIVEVYENPKTLMRMGKWCRAITDLEGNLYVADNSAMIHIWLYKLLIKKEKLSGRLSDYKGYGLEEEYYINSVAWQRRDGSNSLYLAESYSYELNQYSSGMDKIHEYAKNIKTHGNIEFVFKRVPPNVNYKF